MGVENRRTRVVGYPGSHAPAWETVDSGSARNNKIARQPILNSDCYSHHLGGGASTHALPGRAWQRGKGQPPSLFCTASLSSSRMASAAIHFAAAEFISLILYAVAIAALIQANVAFSDLP